MQNETLAKDCGRTLLTDEDEILIQVTEAAPTPVIDAAADSNHVIKKATRAGKALILRQVFVYGSNIAGSVVLARLLPAEQYGFYGITLFAIAFLGIFGGTGFAGNLIRTHEEPSQTDFEVMFTAQQLMVGLIFLVVWFVSPELARTYHMTSNGIWFFRMLGVSLVLTSFMVMPQIKLERDLAFGNLALVEVCQAVSFNTSAILFALKGWGALSFSGALMVRSAVGAVLAHYAAPWKFGFKWEPPVLKTHLQYGVALQAGQFIGMLKDSISPLFVGVLLGAADVGYVTWASSLAAYSVWILMPMQRLYLPLFARLQHDRVRLKQVIEYVLWLANAIAAPLTLITLALANPITRLIFGARWLQALPLYYLFCASNLFVPCSTPMLGALNALGESRKTLYMSIIWMTATWGLGVPLTWWLGINGFGIAIIGVGFTNLVLYRMVWRLTGILPWEAYLPSWPLAILIAAAAIFIQTLLPVASVVGIAVYGIASLAVYAGVLWFIFPSKTRQLLKLRYLQA
jgi:O-antigen/teichoic acid export membrane protein